MFPRWHIILGAIFTLVIWAFAPNLSWVYLLLIFSSSVLIDLDHYIVGAMRTGTLNYGKIFSYHVEMNKKLTKLREQGIKKKADFHFFHTIEFQALIGILGIFWISFFYVFIGMIFHSLVDLLFLLEQDRFYTREYFFLSWLAKKF